LGACLHKANLFRALRLESGESLVVTAKTQQLNRGNATLLMDRKKYMKEVYPKYWITAREKIYGFSEYDKNLCRFISERVPAGEKLLEVAIGTGYPIADFLQKSGYSICGIDISSNLIQKCRHINPDITCTVADVEHLPFADGHFDCTYCFHSTWYFPRLTKAIEEMLRVTRSPGLVIFDLQNRNAKTIAEAYRRRLAASTVIGTIIRCGKNMAKLILRRGTPVWRSIVYEIPTYPESLYKHFESIEVMDFDVVIRRQDHTLETRNEKSSFQDYERLIFVVRKMEIAAQN